MKSRHAAALALVGWYLIVAPIEHTGPFTRVDIKAPMKEWDMQATFDIKESCETARAEYLAYPPPAASNLAGDKFIQCVSADDPRLKAN